MCKCESICLGVTKQKCKPDISETNRIHLVVLFAFRLGHLVPIWQPIIGSSFRLCLELQAPDQSTKFQVET
jgi:Na+-translocating ferredoxin:NAD+ oxidoreductase RnfD subunit